MNLNRLFRAIECLWLLNLIGMVLNTGAFAGQHAAERRVVSATQSLHGHESILTLRYRVVCYPGRGSHMISGSVQLDGRTLRFDLFDSTQQTQVLLGYIPRSMELHLELDESGRCSLLEFNPEISQERLIAPRRTPLRGSEDWRRLALKYAPLIGVRDDQLSNRTTDLPLLMVYDITSVRGHTLLKYTAIFSDEDSKTTEAETNAQMARYGRRTDIEWVYQVEFDQYMNVVGRSYQGGLFSSGSTCSTESDLGHSCRNFPEPQSRPTSFLSNSSHPILFNHALNNVFDAEPSAQQAHNLTAYHLVPAMEVPYPEAREIAMMSHPWTFAVSDNELREENKLSNQSTEYLFLLVDGWRGRHWPLASFRARISFNNDNNIFESGGGFGSVDRVGENMHLQRAYTAVLVESQRLSEMTRFGSEGSARYPHSLLHGRLSFTGSNSWRIESLNFFRLMRHGSTYRVVEITDALSLNCTFGRINETECRF